MSEFQELVKIFGIPGAFVGGVLLIGWRIWVWVRDKLIEPATVAHLSLVNALEKNSEKQSDAAEIQAEQSVKITDSVRNIELAMLKIKDWPSDADRICKAEAALVRAGFSQDKIDRILRRREESEARRGEQS